MERSSVRGRCEACGRAALIASMIALGGCLYGIVNVSAPDRLPASGLPTLARRLSFDVCRPPAQGTPDTELDRERLGDRIREALSRAGVQADLASMHGLPVDFTVTKRDAGFDCEWSLLLSAVTANVIPGYGVERIAYDVNLALPDSAPARGRDRIEYERRVGYFSWMLFLFHQDFFAGATLAGEMCATEKCKDGGFERTIQRLADDLRDRLGRASQEEPWTDAPGVACPVRAEPAGPAPPERN